MSDKNETGGAPSGSLLERGSYLGPQVTAVQQIPSLQQTIVPVGSGSPSPASPKQ